LAGYQLQVASDSGFTTAIENVGTIGATYFIYDCPLGTVRYFRVRAVDFSSNQSAWSNGTRGAMESQDEPQGTNLVANPSAETNAANWTVGGVGGTPALARQTTQFFSSPAAFALTQTRDSVLQRTATAESAAMAITGGREYYLRLYAISPDTLTDDEINFQINWKVSSAGGFFIKQTSYPTISGTAIRNTQGGWTTIQLYGVAPTGATHASVLVSCTVDNYGTIGDPFTLRFDDVLFLPIAIGDNRVWTEYDDDKKRLRNSATWNPPSLSAANAATTTISVTGAVVGDRVVATHSQLGSNAVLMYAHVQSADTVRVTLFNPSGTLDVSSGTLSVTVYKD